ncbi:MAG: hypothetical protein EXR72_05070 [Myxococcales bacterium]|nr:hypothetical protein [Myxococcales bacterium]
MAKSRRDLLRSLTGASLLSTLEGCVPASKRMRVHSKNPPSERAVIPAGKEAEVMALLGPFTREEPAPGYKLAKATVGAERIEFVFAGAAGKAVVSLVAASGAATDGGAGHATAGTFLVLVDGDAPAEGRAAVADRVAAEVRARDRGHLWMKADDAPRSDGGAGQEK